MLIWKIIICLDVSASEESSKPSSSTDGHINKTVTLLKSSLEDEENIPPVIPPVLNRKTCKVSE